MDNAKIGTALLGGYLLGRTKKARLALGLGALLAGSRIRPDQIGRTLQQSPFLKDVTRQVRSELAGASKAAATSVMTAKADNLADALHKRTAGLRDKAYGPAGPDEEDDEEGTAAAEQSRDEVEEPSEELEEPGDEAGPPADEDAEPPRDEEESAQDEAGGSTSTRAPARRRRPSSATEKPGPERSGAEKSGAEKSGAEKSRAASGKSGPSGAKTKRTSAAPSRSRGGGSRAGRWGDD
ncbi:ABC transporter substrate-binding protein [Streptomyces sp. enrichment culture]|uniref:ABC transporter substrate-binding protein n=1 Tax=Streptomyces sp. enrichment culture TaxID=1795815 RepID=UPI003F553C1F